MTSMSQLAPPSGGQRTEKYPGQKEKEKRDAFWDKNGAKHSLLLVIRGGEGGTDDFYGGRKTDNTASGKYVQCLHFWRKKNRLKMDSGREEWIPEKMNPYLTSEYS